MRWGLMTALGLSVALGSAPVWAQDPDAAGTKAEIQLLKDRLEKLERKLAQAETAGDLQGITGMGEKPGSALLALPSGLRGLGMSGYVDTSFVYNFAESDPGAGRTNRGRVFDVNPGGFTIQAAELVLEKPMTDSMPIGFRTDLFFGDDAELIHSTGLPTLTAGNTEAFDLQQAYVTARAPIGAGLDFKVGKFVTLLGAEVIESPANWNFSRSYLFGFAIPFTHTGALATYPLGELGSVTAGVVNGWDIVDDNNNFKSLIGNITLTPVEGVTLAANAITGAELAADNRNDRSVFDLVATWQPIEKLTLMGNYDYGHQSGVTARGVTATPGFDTGNWQGLALYTKYDLTDAWSLAGRWEWFDDKNNIRTGFTGSGGATDLLNDIDFYEWTLTSQWKLHEHVLARLEYRFDTADERVFFHDGGGFIDHQSTVAAELIYHF